MTDSDIIINKMLQEEEQQEQNAELESQYNNNNDKMAEDSADECLSFSSDDDSVTDCSTKSPGTVRSRGADELENIAVARLRAAVMFVLFAATIGVSILVYCYVHNDEKESFEAQFQDDSLKTLNAVGASLDETLGAIDSFIVTTVSYAKAHNLTWPFVTIPDYGVRVAKLLTISQAVYAEQYQVVQPEQRAEWETYSVENDYWVDDGVKTQVKDKTYNGKIVEEYETFGFIHNNDGITPDNVTQLLPTWQSAPIVPDPYNWNGGEYADLVSSLSALMEMQQVVISRSVNTPTGSDGPDRMDEVSQLSHLKRVIRLVLQNTSLLITFLIAPHAFHFFLFIQIAANNDWVRDFVNPDEGYHRDEPLSEIHYPIVDTAADSVTQDQNNGKVVAIFSITFFWRDLIKSESRSSF
jgi:hypothetical protein